MSFGGDLGAVGWALVGLDSNGGERVVAERRGRKIFPNMLPVMMKILSKTRGGINRPGGGKVGRRERESKNATKSEFRQARMLSRTSA